MNPPFYAPTINRAIRKRTPVIHTKPLLFTSPLGKTNPIKTKLKKEKLFQKPMPATA
jgi:hypothetical protein